MTASSTRAESTAEVAVVRPAATTRSAAWVLKRALIGIALLATFAIGGAVLLYATIEPDAAGVSAE